MLRCPCLERWEPGAVMAALLTGNAKDGPYPFCGKRPKSLNNLRCCRKPGHSGACVACHTDHESMTKREASNMGMKRHNLTGVNHGDF